MTETGKTNVKHGSSNPNFRRKLSDFFKLKPDMKYLDTREDYAQKYGTTRHLTTE